MELGPGGGACTLPPLDANDCTLAPFARPEFKRMPKACQRRPALVYLVSSLSLCACWAEKGRGGAG